VSTIVTEQGILHYESVGKGRPIILLHGWINSWDVWRETMLSLANGKGHRVYALDFWGFGHSATRRTEPVGAFEIASYVEMVRQFMDSLGIDQAPLAGHSMGGTVALQFALSHPNRAQKVVLVGAPICGETLNPFLKLAGHEWIARLVWRFPFLESLYPHVVSLLRRGLLADDSERVQSMILRDSGRASTESFFLSIGDLCRTDLRANLEHLSVPALGIYGSRDNIVSPENAEFLSAHANGAEVIIMDRSRHFPMADEPEKFLENLTFFLNNGSSGSQEHIGEHNRAV
jgi:pimeloyl-ACP methyl ester carboxylesterase